jgi:hypothetical protein
MPLEKSVMEAVRDAAAKWGISEYIVHLTAFAHTLASLSRTEPIGVAILTENRARPEIEDVVGLFANTLPLVLAIEPHLPPETLARRVRGTVVEAQVHQEAPIDAIVQRAVAAGIDPFAVQALFLFQDVCSYQVDFGDARAALTDVLGEDSNYLAAWRRPTGFPVALLVESGPEGGVLTLLHHPTLVSEERAGAILDSVRTWLAVAGKPMTGKSTG